MGQHVVKGALVDCDRCGVVHVPLGELVLRVGAHDGRAEVRYRCATCGQICLRGIEPDDASTLARSDVAVEWWEPSAELDEHPQGAPLGAAELAEWIALLADEEALGRAVDALGARPGGE